jgi:hypothetical protein
MKRSLILVEGQTEERFVKDTLAPHFEGLNVSLVPTILVTKKVKNGPDFKGGIKSFGQFERDMQRLLGGAGNALVTTMFDYYRLPADFPGMNDRPATADPFVRIKHVEQAIFGYFNDARLTPFLALHEFEAWVYSCPNTLPDVMSEPTKQPAFADTCRTYPTPEQINENPGNNPAARISALFTAYRKTLHGPTATKRIGLPLIRNRCPHFHQWVLRLEAYAAN